MSCDAGKCVLSNMMRPNRVCKRERLTEMVAAGTDVTQVADAAVE